MSVLEQQLEASVREQQAKAMRSKLQVLNGELGRLLFRGQYVYSELDGINITTLKTLGRSPLHYQHQLRHGKPVTKSMETGTTGHVAILEPERFLKDYVLWKSKYDDGSARPRNGKVWNEFKALHADKTILRDEDYDEAIVLRDAVRADEVAMKYCAMGRPEVAMQWQDAETGALCRGRVDWVTKADNHPAIVDVKTTRNAGPFWFSRDCAKFDYHIQLAFYADGYEAATGIMPRVVVVAVETAPPHDVVTYIVPAEVLEVGRDEYRKLLEAHAECSGSGVWPGQGGGRELTLTLPPWKYPEEEGLDGLGLENDLHGE